MLDKSMDGTSIKVHMDAMVTLSFLCHQQVVPTDLNANSICVSSLCHEVEHFFLGFSSKELANI